MARPRLFTLKAEVAAAPSGPKARLHPFVQVRVDTGVFHLDGLYDYVVPEKYSAFIEIGVRIQVPFGNKEVEAIVASRSDQPTSAGEIKPITKVLSAHPIATVQSLALFDRIALKYSCNPWDIIRSAIPPRVVSVDKTFVHNPQKPFTASPASEEFIQFAPFLDPHFQVITHIEAALSHGSVLVVAPDDRDVDQIIAFLQERSMTVIKLTASMNREERYRNFLTVLNSANLVVVGTRSAIFAPVSDLATIIIFKESSIDHYEVRSPGWNSKAVAHDRVSNEGLKLLLLGFSPSIEVAQKIDNRTIKFVSTKQVVDVKAFTPTDGALLPGRIFTEIRNAVKNGPVLFLAARKGYGNALICGHCKNIAHCECGGRLHVAARNQAPTCVHCGKSFSPWKCSFCQRDKQYLAGRGIERASEEIARAFPNIPVVISAGESIKDVIGVQSALVLATPGAQPFVPGGYAAVVLLDGIRFFSHTDLRSAERARELFFETAAMIKTSGKVLLVIDDVHPIVSAIARWNVAPLIKRELSERSDVNLPPIVDSALLIVEDSEASMIARGLRAAHADNRLPQSVQILGPTSIGKEKSKIVILSSFDDGAVVRQLLHELQRKRSIARKPLLTVRLAPYSL